ncbi:MAG: DUF3576 domain-containing protein [Pseudomonadota bacterium]|nr:DUF3576 domain-containing protein [Pseudomonadota bacterium]
MAEPAVLPAYCQDSAAPALSHAPAPTSAQTPAPSVVGRGWSGVRRSVLRLAAVGMLAGLTACGATDEINFIAGDNTMSFAQDETGRYTRTDVGALGDLSAVLPEGVVPVSGVRSASGELAAAPTSPTAQAKTSGGGGGFGFGNFTFRTARSAELEAERQAAAARGEAPGTASEDHGGFGFLGRFFGMGGDLAAETFGIDEPALGPDGLPVASELAVVPSTRGSVNPYLWDATARTLAFMPVLQANRAAGLFSTDWYSGAEARPERVRVDVQHTSDVLGPGSFHVTVHRQIQEQGMWRTAPSSLPAARELEGQILRAAQQLKISLN